MKLSQFIRENMEEILEERTQFAATIPGTGSMNQEELQDHARQMLDTVVHQIESPNSHDKTRERTHQEHRDTPGDAGEAHAATRLAHGFTLYQIMAEFRALRTSVIRMWQRHEDTIDDAALEQLADFNDGIDRILMDSVSAYSEELDKSRQMFLGVIGHDLRSPLNAMMMCATLIRQDTKTSSRQSRCAQTITRSGEKMERILGDLLDLARTRLGGDIPLDRHRFDLRQLCDEVLAELQVAHPAADIRLQCEGDLIGDWDEGRINQLLWNLGGNAVKHGDQESPVSIIARDEGEKVRIEVHNQGDPVPECSLRSIFDPLTALKHKEHTRVTQSGIGLGLHICRLIVEAHGGEIHVSSSKKDGTRFGAVLPRQCPPEQAKEREK